MSDNNKNKKKYNTSDEDKPKKKKIKNAEKKIKNYNLKAFENFSCYKLCHKIFLEDIKEINADNINSNKELELEAIFDEIIKMGFKLEYKDMNEFDKIQNKMHDEYLKLKDLNKKLSNKYYKDSESSSSSEYESEKKDQMKTNKKLEFDLVLKAIKGKYINNYLEKIKDENYQYINSFEIENDQNYNLCFEIIFASKDVIYKKIQQMLKYAVFLNFLYNMNEILKNLLEKKEQVLKKDNKLNLFIKFFNDKFKFIDLTKKTLLFIVSNGDKNNFENIVDVSKKQTDIDILEDLKKECFNKYNLYFNYSPFDPEKLKEEIINSINKIEEGNKNQIKGENISKTNPEEFKNILEKIRQLEEDNNNIKRDNKKKDDLIKQMQENIENLQNELKNIKEQKKGVGENIEKNEEKKNDKKKENGDEMENSEDKK